MAKIAKLTERETAVVRLVACGLSNPEIAAALGMARRTVRNHLTAVYRAWQVNDRTQATVCAFALGLIEPDEAYRVMVAYGRQEEPEYETQH